MLRRVYELSSMAGALLRGFPRFQAVGKLLRRPVARVEFTTVYLVWFWLGVGIEAFVPEKAWDRCGAVAEPRDWLLALGLLLLPSLWNPIVVLTPLVILRGAVLAVKRRALRWWVELLLLVAAAGYMSTWKFC